MPRPCISSKRGSCRTRSLSRTLRPRPSRARATNPRARRQGRDPIQDQNRDEFSGTDAGGPGTGEDRAPVAAAFPDGLIPIPGSTGATQPGNTPASGDPAGDGADGQAPAEGLRWFDKMQSAPPGPGYYQGPYGYGYSDRVAEAVSAAYPERAITIYTAALNAQLPHAQQAAYESATAYLRKLRPLYKALNRASEWTELVNSIREKYRNRPHFMDLLDSSRGPLDRAIGAGTAEMIRTQRFARTASKPRVRWCWPWSMFLQQSGGPRRMCNTSPATPTRGPRGSTIGGGGRSPATSSSGSRSGSTTRVRRLVVRSVAEPGARCRRPSCPSSNRVPAFHQVVMVPRGRFAGTEMAGIAQGRSGPGPTVRRSPSGSPRTRRAGIHRGTTDARGAAASLARSGWSCQPGRPSRGPAYRRSTTRGTSGL